MNRPGTLPSSLVLVGAGKMGGAMLEGWLAGGLAPAATVVLDPHPSDAIRVLCAQRSIALNPDSGARKPPEALVLAITPQALAAVAPSIDPWLGPRTVLVSILAGKTVANLCAQLPRAAAVIRAMPNLPASVGRGATGAFANAETRDAQRAGADALLASVGQVEWLADENLIDAVTAVSGSGPAYVFHLAECLAEAGAAAGLPPDVAARLARQTLIGAGELLHRSPLPPSTLRQNVTSPGGTTAAALDVLTAKPNLRELVRDAVAAAKRRAGELAD